jgi:hypothetical protein
MNTVSTIVLIIALIAIFLVINGTFNHRYQQPSAQTSEQQPINISDLNNLKGEVVSIQNNASNYPDWIVTGRWKIIQASSDSQSNANLSSDKIIFNASLTMASIDGMESHRHRLTDFNLTSIAIQNRNAVINGTISLVTLGYDKGNLDSNITGIPISIKIMNLETMSIQMDGKVAREHFGNSPIYAKIG